MIDNFLTMTKKTVTSSLIVLTLFGFSAFLIGMQLAMMVADEPLKGLSGYESLRLLLKECDATGEMSFFSRCVEHKTEPFLQRYTLRNAMYALEKVFEERSKNSPRGLACHDVAHIFGEIGFQQANELGKTIIECGRMCGYGCVHGAANAAIRKSPELVQDLNAICDTFSGASFPGQDLTACRHGIGHGLAEFAGLDIVKALTLCDGFNSNSARAECATGVFMEIVDSPILKHERLELPEDIPLFCRSLPDFYAEICLINAGVYEFHRSHDVGKSLSLCKALPADLYRRCNVGLGSDFHFMFSADTAKIWEACNNGINDQKEACVEGALISAFVSDPLGNLGVALCREVSRELKSACLANVGQSMKEINGADEAKNLCAKLQSEENALCLSRIE